jgi:hypothetical protein
MRLSNEDLIELSRKYDDLLLDVMEKNDISQLEFAALVLGRVASISLHFNETEEFERLLNHALNGIKTLKQNPAETWH